MVSITIITDFERALLIAVEAHVSSMVREQIDTKAVRLRRLLSSRGFLEEETVGERIR